jgi:predicted TIM-barrel fold metal-dependent hydrolase
MRRNKVAALYLLPRQYRFSLSDWSVDSLLEPMADSQVPVFVNFNEVGSAPPPWDETDWEAVGDLCRRWPDLPVIVSENRIRRANRTIYRAFDACDNLRVELSGYWLHRGIEYITRRWGARRLIFGSGWPHKGQGCSLATLMCADIDDSDKSLIAGGNLRELMGWCQPDHPSVITPPPEDEFVAFARTGKRPQEMTFLDCHGHLGGRACHYHLPHSTLDETVAEMDRLGVEKACVFSFTVVFSDEAFGNDLVADAVTRHPDRFVGFTGINPHRGRAEMLEELERGASMGLRGVKLIPHYQGFPTEDPLIDIPCQWAHEHGQIILNHNWGSPEQMERLVKAYPGACFLAGHATTAYAEVMTRYPNLYVCTCAVPGPRDCENTVEAIGADRFVYGSDLQDLPIAWGLGPILFARLTPIEKRLILRGNMERILERYSLSP